MPPRAPNRSMSSTFAPSRPAATAAATPAIPPPTTITSVSCVTGTSRTWRIVPFASSLGTMPRVGMTRG